VTPCSVAVGYQHFVGSCCIHHQGEVQESARSSETMVTYRNTTLRHIPEDLELNLHHRENVNVNIKCCLKTRGGKQFNRPRGISQVEIKSRIS
jgi:hypothetical protein